MSFTANSNYSSGHDTRGDESKTVRVGLGLKSGEATCLTVLLKLLGSSIYPFLSFRKQPVDDKGKIACRKLSGSMDQPRAWSGLRSGLFGFIWPVAVNV